jgi:hypothetical protein
MANLNERVSIRGELIAGAYRLRPDSTNALRPFAIERLVTVFSPDCTSRRYFPLANYETLAAAVADFVAWVTEENEIAFEAFENGYRDPLEYLREFRDLEGEAEAFGADNVNADPRDRLFEPVGYDDSVDGSDFDRADKPPPGTPGDY